MTKHFLLLSAAVGVLSLTAGSALAADATDTTSAAPASDDMIGELVVTAEKRSQSLQDVPIAISAFTAETRDLVGILTIQDITNFTPGLSYSTSLDRTSLRGLGRFTNNQGSDGSVAIYSDGVYTSSTFEAGKPPIFVDRVEVLRGPQGTYYGRNSIGGTINVISRRPTDDFYAEARATIGNYGFTEFQGAVSGPVTDWLRLRLAAHKTDQQDGWFHNVMQSSNTGNAGEGNVRDEYYVEGQLEFNIGETFDGWFKVGFREWQNANGGPGQRSANLRYPYNTTVQNATNTATSSQVPNPLFGYTGTQPGLSDPRAFDTNTPGTISLDNAPTFAAELIWHAGGVDVKYVGGYTNYDYNLITDVDASSATGSYSLAGTGVTCTAVGVPSPQCTSAAQVIAPTQIFRTATALYREQKEYYSNEINLISTGDGPVQWIVGAYQYHEANDYTPLDVRVPQQTEFATPVATYTTCAVPGFGIRSPVLGVVLVADARCTASGGSFIDTFAAPNPLRRYVYRNFTGTADSWAGFGQVDWEMNEQIKFTAGIRYTHDERDVVERSRTLCLNGSLCSGSVTPGLTFAYDISASPFVSSIAATTVDPSVVNGTSATQGVTVDAEGNATRRLVNEWEAWTGTLGMDWTPDADTLVYLKYTRGYKAGGFNASGITAAPTTAAEFINAYEMGLKRNWGRVFQMNASIFYYDYQNIQAPLSVPTPTGNRTDFINIPKARNLGLELETIWSPIAHLQILANYALLDSKIVRSGCYADPNDPLAIAPGATPVAGPTACGFPVSPTSRTQDLTGARLPSSPLNRVTLNANYRWVFEPGTLTASATYVYRSATYYDIFNRAYNKAAAYDQTDVRVTWADVNDHYTIVGYVRNVFDELGFDGQGAVCAPPTVTVSPGLTTCTAYSSPTLTPPRTYGIELQYRF